METKREGLDRQEDGPAAAHQAASQTRRQRVIGALTAGFLLAAIVAAVVIGASAEDDSGSAGLGGSEAFGTHYDGLEQRRLAAGVPTMSDSAGGAHIHPELSVYARGRQIPIPVNIGIDPSLPPALMAGLHTHDPSGLIHVENAVAPTLGQFFEVWGVPFSTDRLGPYEAKDDERVRLWVDGQPSRKFADLLLEDGMEVVVAYGTGAQIPPGVGA